MMIYRLNLNARRLSQNAPDEETVCELHCLLAGWLLPLAKMNGF
jgi:hypothetical protein